MQKYALVSWNTGPDKDAVSVIETKWIIDFDSTDISKSYLVECRRPKSKQPVNGWPVEEAKVLQLSAQHNQKKPNWAETLIRKTKRLDFEEDTEEGARSFSHNIKKKKVTHEARVRAAEEILSNLHTDTQSATCEEEATRLFFVNIKKRKATNEPPVRGTEGILSNVCADTPLATCSESSDDGRVKELQSQIKSLQKENAKLRNQVTREIPGLLTDMKKVLSIHLPRAEESDRVTTPMAPKQTAKAQRTASGMTRVLLLGLFSVDVLLRSNLTGGKNKIDPTAEHREPLDKIKLDAIIDTVLKHHPDAKSGEVQKTINTKT